MTNEDRFTAHEEWCGACCFNHDPRFGCVEAAEISRLRALIEALEQEVESWKICVNCGERMTAPGICDRAVTEREKGQEEMIEQLLNERDALKARLQYFISDPDDHC